MFGSAGLSLVDAVGDVIHHVETVDVALCEEIYRVRILLAEQGDQDIGAGHFLLVGGLHMQDGALDDTLETHCGLGIHFLVSRCDRSMRGNEVGQHLAQLVNIHAASTQYLRGGGVVQHGEQQMFDRDELVPLLARLDERQVQTDFQFLCNHFSFPPCRIVTDARVVLQILIPE